MTPNGNRNTKTQARELQRDQGIKYTEALRQVEQKNGTDTADTLKFAQSLGDHLRDSEFLVYLEGEKEPTRLIAVYHNNLRDDDYDQCWLTLSHPDFDGSGKNLPVLRAGYLKDNIAYVAIEPGMDLDTYPIDLGKHKMFVKAMEARALHGRPFPSIAGETIGVGISSDGLSVQNFHMRNLAPDEVDRVIEKMVDYMSLLLTTKSTEQSELEMWRANSGWGEIVDELNRQSKVRGYRITWGFANKIKQIQANKPSGRLAVALGSRGEDTRPNRSLSLAQDIKDFEDLDVFTEQAGVFETIGRIYDNASRRLMTHQILDLVGDEVGMKA